jgi:hypothetical protein
VQLEYDIICSWGVAEPRAAATPSAEYIFEKDLFADDPLAAGGMRQFEQGEMEFMEPAPTIDPDSRLTDVRTKIATLSKVNRTHLNKLPAEANYVLDIQTPNILASIVGGLNHVPMFNFINESSDFIIEHGGNSAEFIRLSVWISDMYGDLNGKYLNLRSAKAKGGAIAANSRPGERMPTPENIILNIKMLILFGITRCVARAVARGPNFVA